MFLKTGLHYDSIVHVDDQSAGGLPSIDKGCLQPSEPNDINVECCKVHTPLQNSALNAAEWDDSSAKASHSVNGNELTYDVNGGCIAHSVVVDNLCFT